MGPWTEHSEKDALLISVESLEEALAAPDMGYHHVLACLRSLEEGLDHHIDAVEGVYREIDATRSTLVRRIARHRRTHADLLREARTLLASAVKPVDGEVPNPDDLYPRIIWLVNAVRHHLAIEHDMVFESACMDIGAGD